MIDLLFWPLLVTLLFAPPWLLWRRAERLGWLSRYMLALLPVGVTWLGWQWGIWAFEHFDCQGNAKGLHDCLSNGQDMTAWVGRALFLSVPMMFIGLPLSGWFLIDTLIRHLGHLSNRE